ncbi:MAG: sugar phosphate nucleotidyltransferase [Pseudomonadota bacterium]
MKVVIFCGGLGTRLREHSETIPKPLVPIGERPILWHLMKYYAYYGHTDFVLCLGYKGHLIKDYFLNYQPAQSSDFILERGEIRILNSQSDVNDWRITFLDTGLHANIGQRFLRAREYLENEDMFLLNYGDQLSDLPLDEHIARFHKSTATGCFAAVKPSSQSFHAVTINDDDVVETIRPIAHSDVWVNGGYMVLRSKIFDYIKEGEELVDEPFDRLIAERALQGYRYDGFWKAMDTFKDKITLDRMHGAGDTPWAVWQSS